LLRGQDLQELFVQVSRNSLHQSKSSLHGIIGIADLLQMGEDVNDGDTNCLNIGGRKEAIEGEILDQQIVVRNGFNRFGQPRIRIEAAQGTRRCEILSTITLTRNTSNDVGNNDGKPQTNLTVAWKRLPCFKTSRVKLTSSDSRCCLTACKARSMLCQNEISCVVVPVEGSRSNRVTFCISRIHLATPF
jgi:hypothetical protein